MGRFAGPALYGVDYINVSVGNGYRVEVYCVESAAPGPEAEIIKVGPTAEFVEGAGDGWGADFNGCSPGTEIAVFVLGQEAAAEGEKGCGDGHHDQRKHS